jgi:hypothetical protein
MLEMHPWRDAVITIAAGQHRCFLDHLLRLAAEDRLQRFCHAVDDTFLQAYVAHLDLMPHTIIGCFDAGQMRGAAELRAAEPAAAGVVEATVSLEKGWLGQGIEKALIVRAISIARGMGARQLLLDRLGYSEALRRTVGEFDAQMVFGDDDCSAWLPLTAAWDRGHPEGRAREAPSFAFPAQPIGRWRGTLGSTPIFHPHARRPQPMPGHWRWPR